MKAVLYTKPTCPFCIRAKALLDEKGIEYEDHDISHDPERRDQISASVGGHRTVPMIFLDGKFIGGNSELQALAISGEL